MMRIQRGFRAAALLPAIPLILSGCIYGTTGNVMSGYVNEHMSPYIMASGDVNMACQTGVSMGAFLMSFERVGTHPDRAALISLLAAAMCAEATGWDAELRRLRAAREGHGAEAQDALTEEKRNHAIAAQRYYGAYRRVAEFAGPVGEGACPTLSDGDQAFYLLGLSAGVLAVLHDKSADGAAGVPTDIPAAVMRASECLSDDHWWGVPSALKSAIWVAAPPLKPAGKDPWAALANSVKQGEAAHVRLASAFDVQTEITAGRLDAARKAITAFAAARAIPPDPNWKLMDEFGATLITHESDKIWTEATGHRTPFGQLGTFPPTAAPADDSSADPFKE